MTGVGVLLRANLRRERWALLWWTLGVTVLYYSQAASVAGLYQTQAALDTAAASEAHNAAFIAMAGPARALNTIGGQVTWQASATGAVVVALMSMFLIGRHTRADEETGRDELVHAAPVDRHAPLVAAAITAMIANVVVGAVMALSLIAYPLAVPDSLGLGIGLTLTGWFFTGTALIAAQLTASTRSMYGIAGAMIGLAYVLRAVGDVGAHALSWVSPIGWYQAMHQFSGLRWWPALLLVVGAALALEAAYAVFARRDVGAGVLAARPGPARASRRLTSALGLAWRLQRGSVIGWSLGLALLGLAYGAIGNNVGDLIGDSQASRDVFGVDRSDLVDSFYATAAAMLALIASGFAISSAGRPRAEEDSGRVEPLLATALPRRTWLLSQVTVTVAGTCLVVLGAGVGLGLGFWMVTGDPGSSGRYLLAALPFAAPVLVLSGVARLLYGIAPRLQTLAWLPLVLSAVVLLFGAAWRLPGWVLGLSPFHHLASFPAVDFRWLPFLGVLVVAAALSVAGQVAFTRRDVR
ncbi:MAG: ABC transporter permease [Nocardioides sp.]